jgi:hypothetical protein
LHTDNGRDALQVEVADALGKREIGKLYVLDPSAAAKMKEDGSQTAQHTSSSTEQERLPVATGKQLQVRPLAQQTVRRFPSSQQHLVASRLVMYACCDWPCS